MQPSVFLTGLSGRQYEYAAYLMDGPWVGVAGNYAFAHQVGQGIVSTWRILYIGETDSFQRRFRDHEIWPMARSLGATHVLAHPNLNALGRFAEERDLIQWWNPPLNKQHRLRPDLGFGSIPFGLAPTGLGSPKLGGR